MGKHVAHAGNLLTVSNIHATTFADGLRVMHDGRGRFYEMWLVEEVPMTRKMIKSGKGPIKRSVIRRTGAQVGVE
jgi:hypothetical protein